MTHSKAGAAGHEVSGQPMVEVIGAPSPWVEQGMGRTVSEPRLQTDSVLLGTVPGRGSPSSLRRGRTAWSDTATARWAQSRQWPRLEAARHLREHASSRVR